MAPRKRQQLAAPSAAVERDKGQVRRQIFRLWRGAILDTGQQRGEIGAAQDQHFGLAVVVLAGPLYTGLHVPARVFVDVPQARRVREAATQDAVYMHNGSLAEACSLDRWHRPVFPLTLARLQTAAAFQQLVIEALNVAWSDVLQR
jgi:hypothetical protein